MAISTPELSSFITDELQHLSALIDSVEEKDYSKLMVNVEKRIKDVKGRQVVQQEVSSS